MKIKLEVSKYSLVHIPWNHIIRQFPQIFHKHFGLFWLEKSIHFKYLKINTVKLLNTWQGNKNFVSKFVNCSVIKDFAKILSTKCLWRVNVRRCLWLSWIDYINFFFWAFSFSQCHWKLPKATKDAPLRYLFHPKFENWKIQWMKCFGQNMCEVSFRTNVQKIFLKTRRKRPWIIVPTVRVYLIFSIDLIRTSLKWPLI